MLRDAIASASMLIPGFLLAVSFHEFSHAYVATILGDDTPRRSGRLTLNPLAHIDPLGLFFLFVFRIGWARPVPFDPAHFRWPRLYSVLTGLAGPFSNFVLALACMYGLAYLPLATFVPALALSIRQVFEVMIYINIMLGVFNLLPLPPLDGSHLLHALIPDRYRGIYAFVARYSLLILILLLYLPSSRLAFLSAVAGMKAFLSSLVI